MLWFFYFKKKLGGVGGWGGGISYNRVVPPNLINSITFFFPSPLLVIPRLKGDAGENFKEVGVARNTVSNNKGISKLVNLGIGHGSTR